MGIRIIGYQPIRFRTVQQIEQEDCQCQGKCFCQLINKNDATTWQINSDNVVVNGTFDTSLEDWNINESLTLDITITNELQDGECDGSIEVLVSGGVGPWEYSIDGVNFTPGNVFDNLNIFTDLCSGCYNIVVKDSLGNLGFSIACVDENVDCNSFDMTDELLPYKTSNFLNCLTSDFL